MVPALRGRFGTDRTGPAHLPPLDRGAGVRLGWNQQRRSTCNARRGLEAIPGVFGLRRMRWLRGVWPGRRWNGSSHYDEIGRAGMRRYSGPLQSAYAWKVFALTYQRKMTLPSRQSIANCIYSHEDHCTSAASVAGRFCVRHRANDVNQFVSGAEEYI